MQSDELSLATRAAWLSYVGKHTQEEIAGRLGVSRIKVNRLIGQAVRAGLVHVFVEGTAAECIALEEAIAARCGLEFCTVAPGGDDSTLAAGDTGCRGRALAAPGARGRAGVADRGRPWPHAGGAGRQPAAYPAARRALRLPARQPDPPRRRQSVRRHPSPGRDHRGRELFHAGAVLRRQHRGQAGAAGAAQPANRCSPWRARPSWSCSASARSGRTRTSTPAA